MYWAIFQFFMQKYCTSYYTILYKIILFDAALLVQKLRCGRVTLNEVLNNYGLVRPAIFTTQKMKDWIYLIHLWLNPQFYALCSHLLKKFLTKKFIFCALNCVINRQKTTVKKKRTYGKVMLLLYSDFLKKSLQSANFLALGVQM